MPTTTRCCTPGLPCAMPDAPWHGTPNGYNNYKCRCYSCTSAWADYYREGPGRVTRDRYRDSLAAAGLTRYSSFAHPVPRKA